MSLPTLLEMLVHLTLLFSAAVVLLVLLRPLLLRAAGAQVTYAAWLLVPLLAASPWLPLPALPQAAQLLPVAAPAMLATSLGNALAGPQMLKGAPLPVTSATAWLIAWGAGALILAIGQAAQQRRYQRSLHRDAAGHWCAPAGASPAMVGVWPQRLVLPTDFQQRFDAAAQRLVLAHEAVHARRHDNAWNLFAVTLLCLQWFNPLAWWAWRRMRDDQELACDAAVLGAEPGPAPLAAYAQAMLAAHPTGWQPALASGWATRHPLVQRMGMLVRHAATSRRRQLAGLALLVGLGTGATLLARAAQEPAPPQHAKTLAEQGMLFELASQLGGEAWTHRKLFLPARERVLTGPFGMSLQVPQRGWCLDIRLHGFEDGSLRPTGQVLDPTCQTALGDWQELRVNGRLVQFVASTAQGPLQAQLSARWMAPNDPALPALMRSDLEGAPLLSAAQQQQLARQREAVAKMQHNLAAQDRAWRQAREDAAQSAAR